MNTQGNWVIETGWQMPWIEAAGDFCSKRPRPTNGCRANVDDDEEQRLNLHPTNKDI